MKKRFILLLSSLLTLMTAATVIYAFHLSGRIEERFSGRRWQLPSRVYADATLLYPGQQHPRKDLLARLYRLDYRPTARALKRKGDLLIQKDHIDIYLKDARLPDRPRTGFPVRITYTENRIAAILRLDTRKPLPLLELAPEELSLFFGAKRERRRLVSIDMLPPHLVHAVLAAEDASFFSHHGVSPTSIIRALWVNLKEGQIRQGASTITQQLAKNFFLTPERTIIRKLKEIIIAAVIEIQYKKKDILEMYLNEIYLGQKGSVSVNGIGEAALLYFGKPASALSIVESATIAGLIKGPNLYSPYRNPAICKKRRNQVLQAMAENSWLPDADITALTQNPLSTVSINIQPRKAPYFTDYLYDQLQRLYSKTDLTSLGLNIYTTLDMQVQIAAEKALENGLLELEARQPENETQTTPGPLQGAVIVIQPRTGYILAMVGGRDYGTSQFNRITQARRQPGSAFKPFVCAAALDRFTPASHFSNAAQSYPTEAGEWTPQNFTPEADTPVSMREALAKSYNRAIVDMAMQTGLDNIIQTARQFNFSSPFKPYPALALGAFEVVPIELANAYCVFASDGVMPHLLSVKKVADRFSHSLTRRQLSIKRIISPAKAYLITDMLQSVIMEGTGRSLKNLCQPFPVAGKTGTTDNYRDAWFVGYTPDLMALVWVGYDNGASIHATGATAALPIWAALINAIPQYISGSDFKQPPGIVEETVCVESGMLPARLGCPEITKEIFLEENIPEKRCPIHGLKLFDSILGGVKNAFEK